MGNESQAGIPPEGRIECYQALGETNSQSRETDVDSSVLWPVLRNVVQIKVLFSSVCFFFSPN